MKYYSPGTRGFYGPDDVLPADAIETTDLVASQVLDAQRQGTPLEVDANGVPIVISAALNLQGMRNTVFPEARALRETILNRLTGIGLAALASGDTTTLTAVATLRLQLLNLTSDPAVLAVTVAQGPEVLRQTILSLYKARAAATPANIRSVFAELDFS